MGLPLEPKFQEFRAKVPADYSRTSLISVTLETALASLKYVMEDFGSMGGYHSSSTPPLPSGLSEIGGAREYFRKVL